MSDQDEQATYRFKWSNYDLEAWVASKRAAANNLRRDAQILIVKADQIDEMCHALKADLIEVEPKEPSE